MEYTYNEIMAVLNGREHFAVHAPLATSLPSLFGSCRRYWELLCQYNELKKGQNMLKPIWPFKHSCSYLDRAIIKMLYNALPEKTKCKFTTINCDCYEQIEVFLEKSKINNTDIDRAMKHYSELLAEGEEESPDSITKNYDDAFSILNQHRNAIKKDVAESVNEVLHVDFRKMIYECLLAKDDITDCTLQMYIGDALGDLQTNTSFEIEHRKPSNTRPRNILYFTKKCLTEPEALPNRIQEIFDVYLDGNNGYNVLMYD